MTMVLVRNPLFGPYLGGSIRGNSFGEVDFLGRKTSVIIVSYGRSYIWTPVRPAKAGVFSGSQSHRGKSQEPRSLDSRQEGNRVF